VDVNLAPIAEQDRQVRVIRVVVQSICGIISIVYHRGVAEACIPGGLHVDVCVCLRTECVQQRELYVVTYKLVVVDGGSKSLSAWKRIM
jgi:hypothetical protein